LVLAARDVRVEAGAERRRPHISIVAYTGGIMRVPGWGDIVIDLAGLDASGDVAILSDHDATRRGVVGHGRAEIAGNKLLRVVGTISATGQAAREIVDAAANGFPWQASVGVEVHGRRRVAAGQRVEVNGKVIEAPAGGFTLVTKGRLREVSVVGIGCDDGTAVSIAASRSKEKSMDAQVQDTGVQETGGLDAEADEAVEGTRVANIASICGAKHPEIQARAIEEGWDETRCELEVLRASRPKAPAVLAYAPVVATGAVLEAALLDRMGMSGLGERALGPMAMEQADRLGATNMIDLCRAALQADGRDIPAGRMEMIRASLSTMSLPTALGNVASKVLLDSYNETPASWRAFCAIRSVADFKTNTAIRPSFTGQIEPVAPGGELKHGSVAEAMMQYQIDTFGKMLSIDRRDIINDDLGVFQDAAASYGRMGMRKVSDLVYEVLLANTGPFFSAGNGNYLDGADSALSIISLAQAIALMRTQRDDEGNDLDLRPATLLVTPELEPTARTLLESEYIQRAEDVPTGNSLRRAVNLEVEPRLSNTTKFGSDASTKHWYLFTKPSAVPMIVAFLNGMQTPTVEYFGLDQNVSRLAVSWRVYHDFGAALCDPRAAVRSKGQA
ncbi:MAG: Mu-like prophage major head subunit gpT family protein, partial [Planctomycetes bacterium]|nr:Mu-like prophage major head subunit gpT family protein [Planctomycetota bacterium]